MPGKMTYGGNLKPIKRLYNIPNHLTYRQKLDAKWMRKGFRAVYC